jgi:hypothetical protein
MAKINNIHFSLFPNPQSPNLILPPSAITAEEAQIAANRTFIPTQGLIPSHFAQQKVYYFARIRHRHHHRKVSINKFVTFRFFW